MAIPEKHVNTKKIVPDDPEIFHYLRKRNPNRDPIYSDYVVVTRGFNRDADKGSIYIQMQRIQESIKNKIKMDLGNGVKFDEKEE